MGNVGNETLETAVRYARTANAAKRQCNGMGLLLGCNVLCDSVTFAIALRTFELAEQNSPVKPLIDIGERKYKAIDRLH